MKKINRVIILLIITLFPIVSAKGATNPYKPTTQWGVNCTYKAWQEVYDRLGIALPGWGNAKDWYNDAQKSGYAVGDTPKPNSIAVWDNFKSYGHVAFIEKVEGTTIFYIDAEVCYRELTAEENAICYDCLINETVSQEDSWKCDHVCYKKTTCSKSGVVGDDKLIGYIYVTEAKVKAATSTTSKPSTKTNKDNTKPTSSNQTTKKSSNSKLKILSIEGVTFGFSPDTLEYKVDVENEIEKISATATAEDEKANVDIQGDINLKEGENLFKIVVTAEDGSKSEYKLIVNRKEKESEPIKEEIPSRDTSNNKKERKINNKLIYIIGGLSILLVGGIIIIKKHK